MYSLCEFVKIIGSQHKTKGVSTCIPPAHRKEKSMDRDKDGQLPSLAISKTPFPLTSSRLLGRRPSNSLLLRLRCRWKIPASIANLLNAKQEFDDWWKPTLSA